MYEDYDQYGYGSSLGYGSYTADRYSQPFGAPNGYGPNNPYGYASTGAYGLGGYGQTTSYGNTYGGLSSYSHNSYGQQ